MTGLVVDNFAGGGGASTGIEAALGRAVDIAINHDEAALRMHEANHPGTRHIRNNIWHVHPTEACAGQPVELAWFSPDCKHFSKAKGGKPREKSIRDLAWIVVLWAQKVKPRCIFLENVEEFRTWGPLDGEGQIIKERVGETFDKWCRALRRQGYKLQFRELRACDYGAPTIRKRFFMIARCDGDAIVWPAPTHGAPDSPEVLSGSRKPWRTAAEIIDWTIECPSIFERKKELADKTKRRIAHGIVKFVLNNPTPFIVPLTHHGSAERSYTPDHPLHTVTGAHRGELSVVVPHVTKFRAGAIGHAADEPLHTVTANSYIKRPGGAAPLGLVEATLSPVIVGCGGRRGQSGPVGPEQPFPTITAKADACLVSALLAPFVAGTDFKNTRACRVFAVTAPVRTQTAQPGYAVAAVTLVKNNFGSNPAQAIDASLHTITTQGNRFALVAAHLINTRNGEREGQAPRALSVEQPFTTVTAKGSQGAVVHAFMQKFADNGRGYAPTEPLHTVMAGAPRHAAVTAHLAQFSETREGRKLNPGHSVEEPVSTIVQKGPLQALVASNLVKLRGTCAHGQPVGEPLHTVSAGGLHMADVEASLASTDKAEVVSGHAREVAAFLLKYYGNEDDGHEPTKPLGTVTTKDRFGLVTVTIDGEEYVIVDIGMRMLTPRELFNAQGFPPDYIIDHDADGRVMTKKAQVAKCGNSVCPPLAQALVAANAPSVAEQRKRAAA